METTLNQVARCLTMTAVVAFALLAHSIDICIYAKVGIFSLVSLVSRYLVSKQDITYFATSYI